MLTRHDKILAIVIILVAVLSFLYINFSQRDGGLAEKDRIVIEAMGEVVQVIPLDELEPGKQIPITGPLGDSILEMGEDQVRLVYSPCPDHLCVLMGWINQPGEMIVCLPNVVMVRIEGGQETGRDSITR